MRNLQERVVLMPSVSECRVLLILPGGYFAEHYRNSSGLWSGFFRGCHFFCFIGNQLSLIHIFVLERWINLNIVRAKADALGYPMFIKPVRAGSCL